MGYAAEIAVAKYLGQHWTPGGIAISSGDVNNQIEVRSTSYASGHLLIYATDNDNAPVVLATGDYPKFRIAGMIRARDGKKQKWWNTSGETPCYWVPQSALKPLREAPGRSPGAVSYFMSEDKSFLHCRLPSGRLLAYLHPEVHNRVSYRFNAINERGSACIVMFPAKVGVAMNRVRYHAEKLAEKQKKTLTNDPPESFITPHLSFMGRDTYTKQWKRCGTHGGTLTENADQASSRDLLAESMWRVDQSEDFDLLLSIHDEVVAEAPIGTATIKEFEAMMAIVPDWATNMPIAAEGWIGPRLRK